MKHKILSGILAGLLVAGLAWAVTVNRRTDRFDFINGIRSSSYTDLDGNAVHAAGMPMSLIFCGQAAENGTIYLSPAAGVNGVDLADGVDYSISGTACDGLDGVTEATQDLIVFPDNALKVTGMYCQVAGTLGAAETVVFTMRSAAADVTPSVTCTVSEAERGCSSLTETTTNIAANATLAMKAVESSDNADDDLWCQVNVMIQ